MHETGNKHDSLGHNFLNKYGLQPITSAKELRDLGVFMDEEDESLYKHVSGSEPKNAPSLVFSMNGKNLYIHDNIIFKVTNANELVHTSADSGRRSVGNMQSIQKWKIFGRQFLSMDVLFDSLFLLSKRDSKQKLRVPLSALIDYKGFRCVAIGAIPIGPERPTLGFHERNYVPTQPELKNAFANVGEAMHLKENRAALSEGQTFESIPVSYFAKLYNFSQSCVNEMKMNQAPEPSKQGLTYHFNELDYMDQELLFYCLKTSEMFPYDIDQSDPDTDRNTLMPKMDLSSQVSKRAECTLRPEFTCSYEHEL